MFSGATPEGPEPGRHGIKPQKQKSRMPSAPGRGNQESVQPSGRRPTDGRLNADERPAKTRTADRGPRGNRKPWRSSAGRPPRGTKHDGRRAPTVARNRDSKGCAAWSGPRDGVPVPGATHKTGLDKRLRPVREPGSVAALRVLIPPPAQGMSGTC